MRKHRKENHFLDSACRCCACGALALVQQESGAAGSPDTTNHRWSSQFSGVEELGSKQRGSSAKLGEERPGVKRRQWAKGRLSRRPRRHMECKKLERSEAEGEEHRRFFATICNACQQYSNVTGDYFAQRRSVVAAPRETWPCRSRFGRGSKTDSNSYRRPAWPARGVAHGRLVRAARLAITGGRKETLEETMRTLSQALPPSWRATEEVAKARPSQC